MEPAWKEEREGGRSGWWRRQGRRREVRAATPTREEEGDGVDAGEEGGRGSAGGEDLDF